MDSGWAQALIAGVAAVVAVIAAVLSARQAREAGKQADQAKRQADAAHGDVSPTFHIERLPEGSHAENCCIVVRNFNRHALVVHEVRIHHPTNIGLLPNSTSIRGALEQAVIKSALERDGLCVIRPKATLEGVMPGGDPSDFRIGIRATGMARASAVDRLAVQFSDIVEGRRLDLSYEVDFELLDGSGHVQLHKGRAGLRF